MQFIAQLPLKEHDGVAISSRPQKLLIFQCQSDPGMCDEWDADSGGNCAIVTDVTAHQKLAVPKGNTLLPEQSNIHFKSYDDSKCDETPDDQYCEAFDAEDSEVLGKVGGRPLWIQGDETPDCSSCGSKMVFFAQIEDRGGGGINFGDCGAGYVFVCGDCSNSAKFLWQCG